MLHKVFNYSEGTQKELIIGIKADTCTLIDASVEKQNELKSC